VEFFYKAENFTIVEQCNMEKNILTPKKDPGGA